jgi:hypothetical protein
VRDVPAGPVAALDRPDPAAEPAAGREHLRITGLAGAIPARRQNLAPLADHLDRR